MKTTGLFLKKLDEWQELGKETVDFLFTFTLTDSVGMSAEVY